MGSLPGGGAVAQELLLELAMEPVAGFVEPYNDVMLRVAAQVDKMVSPLKIHNGNLMVIPEIYSGLFSTFVHAFRNAVDHGIEMPDHRVDIGKPAEGQVDVTFSLNHNSQGSWLLVQIKDDGGGIDPARIREKLTGKGLDVSAESDQQIIQHIFDSQFSTREHVTDISGRGVGMDAIKVAAEELAGRVWVESTVGQGSTLFVEVPYITEFQKDKKLPTAA
ncbi:ATP-binding protein [Bdellovibrio bacteriovorus]|uniref:ATP-binding protein n=1 Tax=Bdellovibrio bacteriovorus TaxID=959 RepID=UPI0035A5CF92